MAKNIKGINLEIGGDTAGLNRAFAETDKQLRKTAGELKEVERYLKLDPQNTELLAQKEKLLGDQIGLTAEKAELLERAQRAADEAIKSGTSVSEEQYRRLQREIVGTSSQMQRLSEESESLHDASGKAAKGIEEIGEAGKSTSGGFTILKGAVADFAGSIVKDFAASLVGAVEESREFRQEMALLEAAGEAQGYTAEQTSEAYSYLYSVLGDETASRTALNNAQALGMSQSDLMGLLQSGIGAWAQYGDSIPIDGLMEAINETSKVGTVTGVLADALNWAGISEDAFNEQLAGCSSEQERQRLIAAALNGEYSDLAESYVQNNEELVKFNQNTLKQNEATAAIGEKLQPIQDKLTEIKTGCLDKIADMFLFIEEHSTVFEVLAGLLGSLTLGIIAFNAVQTVKNILDEAQNSNLLLATAAQLGLNTAMLTSPITWMVALIAGLVVAFVLLWKKCDGFREFWLGAWDAIQNAFGKAKDAIANGFNFIVEKVKSFNIAKIGENLLEGLWNGINDKVEWLKSKVLGVVDKIKSWFTGKSGFDTHSPSKWSEKVFENVMEGGALGIAKTNGVLSAVRASVGRIRDAISDGLNSSVYLSQAPAAAAGGSGAAAYQSEGAARLCPNVVNNYYGYKGTISENNAALKRTLRDMEVSLI